MKWLLLMRQENRGCDRCQDLLIGCGVQYSFIETEDNNPPYEQAKKELKHHGVFCSITLEEYDLKHCHLIPVDNMLEVPFEHWVEESREEQRRLMKIRVTERVAEEEVQEKAELERLKKKYEG